MDMSPVGVFNAGMDGDVLAYLRWVSYSEFRISKGISATVVVVLAASVESLTGGVAGT
jgi:hypothetical protein